MQKRDQGQMQVNEEIIMTLPAAALDTLAAPVGSQSKSGHDGMRGDSYMGASPVGRDEPFPCFLKSNWSEQVVVKIVQQRQQPHAA